MKRWDSRFGGTNDDALFFMQQTFDGGYLLSGFSNSGTGGDKTEPGWGDWDYWIVKTDSLGNKTWDKNFGGTFYDQLHSSVQTSDGGYVLGGSSWSGIGGDKTQPTWGVYDYWIVKTDSLGNKEWDKDFGGTDAEDQYSIQQTSDGGFILGGCSHSGISGDKTQPVWGNNDFWIVKIDSIGNKQWDKDFGGTEDDILRSVQQTFDGGYILGGYSKSGISGDKTQTNWDASGNTNDFWIIKTDALGNKLWDRDFGGTNHDELWTLKQTKDSGYIMGGWTYSGIGGNKTQPCWGNMDYWIVKTDSLGNIRWDKDFGGTSGDGLNSIQQTLDSGYLISGVSSSSISGNKTEANLGVQQTWVLKIDSVGNIIWDKTLYDPQSIGGICQAIQTTDGCYAMATGITGGMGGYRSQSAWGGYDYWMVKFCDTTGAFPITSIVSATNLCPGTCTDFINLSFNATSYQWNLFGASPDTSTAVNPANICYSTPGTYDVQLIASNANGSDTLLLTNYITVYASPPPQSIIQSGDTLFAIAGSASYQWYFNTNNINGATNYFYVAPVSGDYNVVATDVNECEVEAAVFNVVASVNTIRGQEVFIFPNPAEEFVVVSSEFFITGTNVSIFNMLGEKLPTALLRTTNSEQRTIDVRALAKGMYWLEISSGSKTFRTKFLKQ